MSEYKSQGSTLLVPYRRDLDNDIVRMFQLGHVDLLDPDLMRSDIINRLHSIRGHYD